jgi:hypothetical protein
MATELDPSSTALTVAMEQPPKPAPDIAVDVIESPDGVLNVYIRTSRPAESDPTEILRYRPRRPPRQVH